MHTAKEFKGSVSFDRATELLSAMSRGKCYPRQLISGPVVLYGKGNLGKLAQAYCKAVGQPVSAFIEKEEVADNPTVAVCVVSEPYVPIERSLLARGFTTVLPFYDLTEQFRGKHPLSNGWYAGAINQNTHYVLSAWNDDVSRAHHLQFIAWHKLREEWCFDEAPVIQNNRYFIPEVAAVLNDEEAILDVSTSYDQRGFHYRMSGIDELKHFNNLGFYIQALEMDAWETLEASIDSLKIKPSFIKLHLEGHELKALKGAAETIATNRPIIAVTVYHNSDGIWKIPLWLIDNLNSYRFFFRLHCWCGSNAVVYAIPNERVE